MSRRDIRSTSRRRPIMGLLRDAGMAPGRENGVADAGFEQLEARVMLAGDHPSFNEVFLQGTPATQMNLVGGAATATGLISPAMDDDVFRFTAATSDFVRVWADALNAGGSLLDSRVQVWTRDASDNPILVASGSNNGTLTSGVFRDGWAGFRAEAGREYFVQVLSDQATGAAATGNYTIRVNAQSLAFPALNGTTGEGQIIGNVTIAGGDVVYSLTTGSASLFDSLMTIAALRVANLDTRLDIYASDGTPLRLPNGTPVFDDDTGNLNDAFLAFRASKSTQYFVRVRSDQTAGATATGAFTLLADGIGTSLNATPFTIDPVTRVLTFGGGVANAQSSALFTFRAQGSGFSFVTVVPAPGGIPDTALRLHDDTGARIAFNELPGPSSLLFLELVGGRTYHLIVENFDGTAGGGFVGEIEVHHTFDPTTNPVQDDHVNTPPGTASAEEQRRIFESSTPIVWSAPQDYTSLWTSLGLPAPPNPPAAGERSEVVIGMAQGRIFGGADTDLFQFVPPVDMLSDFDGLTNGVPFQPPLLPGPSWMSRYLPGTRLNMFVNATEVGFVNTRVRVYDSNFEEIWSNSVIIPPLPRVSGALDPASLPPESGATASFEIGGPTVWGGEVYYLEVSADSGSGRYTVSIQADAPSDNNFWTYYVEPTGAGDFGFAQDIDINPNTGEARNYSNVAGGSVEQVQPGLWQAFVGPAGDTDRSYYRINAANRLFNPPPAPTNPPSGTLAGHGNNAGTPGTSGRVIFEMGDLANIRSVTDTHLYKFRAIYTGTAEVRLNTTAITDEFFGAVVTTETNDPSAPPPPAAPTVTTTSLTRTYNSPLDGALRIFDNDFQEISYNNDSYAVAGESGVASVGDHGDRTFFRRDPRTVFHVEAGKTYYIQVESGQAGVANPEDIDWRHATGSYELLINSMSNQLFIDDHENSLIVQATPIPVDLSVTSTTAVMGAVDGQIQNVAPLNPTDEDLFSFVAPAPGTVQITVATRAGDSFGRTVQVIDAETTALLTEVTATGNLAAVANVTATQGQKFLILVFGASGADQGRYTVRVAGVPVNDDHSDGHRFGGGTVIDKDLYDFDRTETVLGALESTGDTDVFRFEALTFDVATISVRGLTPSLRPVVRVYEISEDPVGFPVPLQIGFGTGDAFNDGVANVSITAPRTSTLTGRSFKTYYVVISGLDPNADKGEYQLTLDFGVATDDHPDSGQFALARDPDPLDPTVPHDSILINPDTGTGGTNGQIEQSGDTDLFKFTSAAGGLITLNLVSPTESLLFTGVRVFDANGQPVHELTLGTELVAAPDDLQSVATFQFVASRGATYFIQVEGLDPAGNTFKTADFGRYLMTITTPIPDDHANESEFPIATPIFIAGATGLGASTGVLEATQDTDLFTFIALDSGSATVTIDTPNSTFVPALRLFQGDTSEIGGIVVDGGAGDEDGIVNGSVRRTFSVNVGESYYILVGSSPADTGDYTVAVRSPRAAGVPADDHANTGDFDSATFVPLSAITGDGDAAGQIEAGGDTDLFFFTSLSGTAQQPRPAFVQVVTGSGAFLNVGVKVFGPDRTLLVSDTVGGPGFNAGVSFTIAGANQKYWVEVENIDGIGAYTVRIDTAPEVYQLFYPEGFASETIREYVSIGNSNAFDVTYSIRLRYEGSLPEVVIASNQVLAPNSRGGITISDGPNGALAGVAPGVPYSIIIESSGFLGANISHYDFNSTLGEAFTSRASDFWSFAKGERQPGAVRDFVVFYNPNPTAATVTFTAYKADGTTFSMEQTVEGFRRGGWNLPQTAGLGVGQFAFTVSSRAANGADPHEGVVVALSHYDLVNNTGYGVLGDPDGGATAGVLPGLMQSSSVQTRVTFFNPTATPATVSIVGRYIGVPLPAVTRTITVNPFSFVNMTGADLGFTENQLVGLRYDSNTAVSVIGGTIRPGSTPPNATTDVTQANTGVATSWFWGDAFLNRFAAGTLYFENMFLYNPDVNPMTVTLKFVWTDGFTDSIDVVVGAKDFASVALHEVSAILGRRVFNFFSVEASASTPFAAKMNHFDLVLDGGWGSKGGALGLVNPISLT